MNKIPLYSWIMIIVSIVCYALDWPKLPSLNIPSQITEYYSYYRNLVFRSSSHKNTFNFFSRVSLGFHLFTYLFFSSYFNPPEDSIETLNNLKFCWEECDCKRKGSLVMSILGQVSHGPLCWCCSMEFTTANSLLHSKWHGGTGDCCNILFWMIADWKDN